MTQQPYYPPQYPQVPQQPAQQGYPPQVQGAYPPQAYAQPPQQQFMPGVQMPPAAPPVPLAQGTIDDYYAQPSGGGGPSISWKGKADGTTYAGIVARDVTNADVQQDTDPQTRAPRTYKDGRPKFSMKVRLKVQPSQEFPEGEAALYVRGQMRDELVRAMGEVGASGAPKAGDGLVVSLVQRKQIQGGGMPMNVFAVRYQSAAGGTGAPSPAPVPAEQPQPVTYEVPSPYDAVPPQVQPAAQAPVQGVYGEHVGPAPVQQQAPQAAPAPAQGPAVPEGMSPEQAALLAKLTGQQG